MQSAKVDILARTLFGEARGELYGGRIAIANVIVNRVLDNRTWWGTDLASVCKHPYQFSCWNESDPNRRVIEEITDSDPTFQECIIIAEDASSFQLPDITFGACHYHAKGVKPGWAKGKTPIVQIGNHIFFSGLD
mgnify:CR=1 FL=1